MAIWEQLTIKPPDDEDNAYPKRWNDFSGVPSIVLLGPPRAGKTTEFRYQRKECDGFLIELRDVLPNDPTFAWNNSEKLRWEAFLAGDEPKQLFIDSLDEGKLETPAMAKYLVEWLQGLHSHALQRLRVHISCREREWDRVDQNAWNRVLFRKSSLNDPESQRQYLELALLPLDNSTIASFLAGKQIVPDEFSRQFPANAHALLRWPQSLKMIAGVYLSEGLSGYQIGDLYRKVIERRIQESNELRKGIGNSSLSKKVSVAKRLASISVLSGRDVLATHDANSGIEVDAGIACDSRDILLEVVSSELFEFYQVGKHRFEDRYIAAYLAAWEVDERLNDHNIELETVTSLLYADPQSDEIIPALRSFVSWLAYRNSLIRRAIIDRSPELLLSDDYPGEIDESTRMSIWQWMKNAYGDRIWFDDERFRSNAGKLFCDEVILDVGIVLQNPDEYGRDIRIFGLEILCQSEARAHEDIIVQSIFSTEEDEVYKRYAIRALKKNAPERLSDLKPMLEYSTEKDPNLDTLGSVLCALFPDFLSTEEIIAQLKRSSSSSHYGAFQSFVFQIARELDADSRARILDALDGELTAFLNAKKSHQKGVPDWMNQFVPAYESDKFLLSQIHDWAGDPAKYTRLEKWLALLAEANVYGLVHGGDVQKISDFINENTHLRQNLCRLRIERLFNEHGDAFDPSLIHLHERLYMPKKEDLGFWKGVVVSWHGEPQSKLEAAWQELQVCWNQSEPTPEMLDWAEQQASAYPTIAELWDRDRFFPINDETMKWRWEHAERHREEAQQKQQEIQNIRSHLGLIRSGEPRWIIFLISKPFGSEDGNIFSWLQSYLGNDAVEALFEGLRSFWESAEEPDIDMYLGNEVPYWSFAVQKAVETWLNQESDWDLLTSDLRQKAIKAALWSLNDLPEWFYDAASVERAWALDFCLEVLKKEVAADKELLRLPHLFSGQGHRPFVQQVIGSFLESNSDVPMNSLRQLLRVLFEGSPSTALLNHLWQAAKNAYAEENEELALYYAAAVFRYQQSEIWAWVKEAILTRSNHVQCFQSWLGSIEAIHSRFELGSHWPAWMEIEIVSEMLPFMFKAFPPESDIVVNGVMSGDVLRRNDRARLRDNTFQFMAESGHPNAGHILGELLSEGWASDRRDSILHSIDLWKQRLSQNNWIPLAPENIRSVLYENKIPIRTSDELFAFFCKLFAEIKNEIERGEASIKSLLWNDDGSAKKEKDFQRLVFEKLRDAIRRYDHKIAAGRELDISGNFPDIFISITLPNGNLARVFVEMKRQQHNEVVDAIENQLIEKYLADADTTHGIYLVGWYGPGPDKYGHYKRKLKNWNNGQLPENSQDFEETLQKIADDCTQNRGLTVKALVMDITVGT